MALGDLNVFSKMIIDSATLEHERAALLLSVSFNENPLHTDKIFLDWVNELQQRINELENK